MKVTSSGLVLILASLTAAQDVSTSTWWPFPPLPALPSLPPLFPLVPVIPDLLTPTIKVKNLLAHANKLLSLANANGGNRSFGSPAHNATVQYIASKLRATGYYDVELQSFPWLFTDGKSSFAANGTDYPTIYFQYGVSGDVSAPLVLVGDGCTADLFPPTVAGNIALIQRGTCEFGHKVALAGAAGAAGAVIYNNADGLISGGTLGAPRETGPYIATAGISGEDGAHLAATIAAGSEVIGKVWSSAVNETRWSSNVFATSKQGDKNNVVMAGAHSDSVPAGPGINDDGSGTIGLLEIALNLPKWRVLNAVRFAFWTAEEVGLVGSEHYVTTLSESERQKIALYLNFDMIASVNGGYFILDGDGSTFNLTGPAGSEHIQSQFAKYFKTRTKIATGAGEFSGRSDYGPFLEFGIPAGGIDTGADGILTEEEAKLWGGKVGIQHDPCYHKACDTVENLDTKKFVEITKAAAHTIASYALSLKGIPRPRPSAEKAVAKVAKLSVEDRAHYTCGHEILRL